jgi:hypothetical protein
MLTRIAVPLDGSKLSEQVLRMPQYSLGVWAAGFT